jgi:hypothetical protein
MTFAVTGGALPTGVNFYPLADPNNGKIYEVRNLKLTSGFFLSSFFFFFFS